MPIRTIVVSRDEASRRVGALLKEHLRLTWSQIHRLVEQNRVRQGPRLCRDAQSRVRAGQKLRVQLDNQPAKKVGQASGPPAKHVGQASGLPAGQRPAPRNATGPQPIIRYVDKDIVVVDKPVGLTTMRHPHEAAEFGKRGKRFLPTTLADMLPPLLESQGKGRGRVIAVHRLDRDTSGLVVFARNAEAARHLGAQFRGHTTERSYVALVRGRARAERIESLLIVDRGDGRRGSSKTPGEGAGEGGGQRAVTHVRVQEQLGEFTLVSCRLETGRTHQVRIHLGERGTPICGERIYDRPLHGAPLPDKSSAKRLALHAASLALDHPTTGKRMTWTAALPEDMARLLTKLRKPSSR